MSSSLKILFSLIMILYVVSNNAWAITRVAEQFCKNDSIKIGDQFAKRCETEFNKDRDCEYLKINKDYATAYEKFCRKNSDGESSTASAAAAKKDKTNDTKTPESTAKEPASTPDPKASAPALASGEKNQGTEANNNRNELKKQAEALIKQAKAARNRLNQQKDQVSKTCSNSELEQLKKLENEIAFWKTCENALSAYENALSAYEEKRPEVEETLKTIQASLSSIDQELADLSPENTRSAPGQKQIGASMDSQQSLFAPPRQKCSLINGKPAYTQASKEFCQSLVNGIKMKPQTLYVYKLNKDGIWFKPDIDCEIHLDRKKNTIDDYRKCFRSTSLEKTGQNPEIASFAIEFRKSKDSPSEQYQIRGNNWKVVTLMDGIKKKPTVLLTDVQTLKGDPVLSFIGKLSRKRDHNGKLSRTRDHSLFALLPSEAPYLTYRDGEYHYLLMHQKKSDTWKTLARSRVGESDNETRSVLEDWKDHFEAYVDDGDADVIALIKRILNDPSLEGGFERISFLSDTDKEKRENTAFITIFMDKLKNAEFADEADFGTDSGFGNNSGVEIEPELNSWEMNEIYTWLQNKLEENGRLPEEREIKTKVYEIIKRKYRSVYYLNGKWSNIDSGTLLTRLENDLDKQWSFYAEIEKTKSEAISTSGMTKENVVFPQTYFWDTETEGWKLFRAETYDRFWYSKTRFPVWVSIEINKSKDQLVVQSSLSPKTKRAYFLVPLPRKDFRTAHYYDRWNASLSSYTPSEENSNGNMTFYNVPIPVKVSKPVSAEHKRQNIPFTLVSIGEDDNEIETFYHSHTSQQQTSPVKISRISKNKADPEKSGFRFDLTKDYHNDPTQTSRLVSNIQCTSAGKNFNGPLSIEYPLKLMWQSVFTDSALMKTRIPPEHRLKWKSPRETVFFWDVAPHKQLKADCPALKTHALFLVMDFTSRSTDLTPLLKSLKETAVKKLKEHFNNNDAPLVSVHVVGLQARAESLIQGTPTTNSMNTLYGKLTQVISKIDAPIFAQIQTRIDPIRKDSRFMNADIKHFYYIGGRVNDYRNRVNRVFALMNSKLNIPYHQMKVFVFNTAENFAQGSEPYKEGIKIKTFAGITKPEECEPPDSKDPELAVACKEYQNLLESFSFFY